MTDRRAAFGAWSEWRVKDGVVKRSATVVTAVGKSPMYPFCYINAADRVQKVVCGW
ncbi:hypothetical protein Mal15_51410 [Stieleria maiorica]|uniref:Uncharacterized protein n=1 Tax=Stieleria maiorica TaxID=2795974 RepID=A0A5B9MN31_9BACT|nr:hypothetical protein Mal15_51410 [Stieleria maiorica]